MKFTFYWDTNDKYSYLVLFLYKGMQKAKQHDGMGQVLWDAIRKSMAGGFLGKIERKSDQS